MAGSVGNPLRNAQLGSIGTEVYEARRAKQWLRVIVFLLPGLLGLLALIRNLWITGGAACGCSAVFGVVAFLFLPIGFLHLVNVLRGWPRLVVAPEGIRLDSSAGITWAKWTSLGPFEAKAFPHNPRILIGTAKIVGEEASKIHLKMKSFFLTDIYTTPIGKIVDDLNTQRTFALGPPAQVIVPWQDEA